MPQTTIKPGDSTKKKYFWQMEKTHLQELMLQRQEQRAGAIQAKFMYQTMTLPHMEQACANGDNAWFGLNEALHQASVWCSIVSNQLNNSKSDIKNNGHSLAFYRIRFQSIITCYLIKRFRNVQMCKMNQTVWCLLLFWPTSVNLTTALLQQLPYVEGVLYGARTEYDKAIPTWLEARGSKKT